MIQVHFKDRCLRSAALLALIGFSAVALAKEPAAPAASGEDQPYPPSYITTADKENVKVEEFTDPEMCGQCHSRQYEGWNGSMHSNAFKDPVFQALWAMGEKATKGEIGNHCAGCHTPIGTASETVTFNPDDGKHGSFSAPGVAAKGVSCDVCHTISDTNLHKTAVLEHGNASFVLSPGPEKRATLKGSTSTYHETEYSEHHASSEFCGNCHNIFHPTNNFPIERTYDEWKYSVYAQNGIQCQDCHMVPVEIAKRVADEMKRPHELKDHGLGGFAALGGPYRELVHDHGFVGGNAVITAAMQGEESDNHQEAVKRLQSVADVDVKLEVVDQPLHRLKVKVTNKRAGHHLPTSLTEVRQVWLEIVVTDDKGRELKRSGTLDERNELPYDTVIFNAHAVDRNGQDTALPWEIARFTEVTTIPPKGYKYGKYYFNVPQDATKLNVVTKLHYRSFSQGLADLLLGDGAVNVPSVEMNVVEKTFDMHQLKDINNKGKKTALGEAAIEAARAQLQAEAAVAGATTEVAATEEQ